MKPGSFDYETCREFIGESAAAKIEKNARDDADMGECDAPRIGGETWTDLVESHMKAIIYGWQHRKRTERNLRKK